MKFSFPCFLGLVLLATIAPAQQQIGQNTTVAAQTRNNTSAPNFHGLPNGNAVGNVSPLSVSGLLPSGFNVPLFAHYMPWWGLSSHPNIGVDERDPQVVQRQVQYALSIGVTGFLIDWYGKSNQSNQATLNVRDAAENTNGSFQFALMLDQGAIDHHSPTSSTIAQLQYAQSNYFGSAAYYRVHGRPVVLVFGTDSLHINWNQVAASLPSSPLFIFENTGGYSHSQSGGAYSWISPHSDDHPNSDPMSLNYLSNFYASAQHHSSAFSLGSFFKGFDDSIAPWGSDRLIKQNCGFTIYATAQLAHDVDMIQIPTWNDYQEGTSIEDGVDNCITMNASLDGNGYTLDFAPVLHDSTASESTIDHYIVYSSPDQQTLTPMANLPRGTRSNNLSNYHLQPGTYYFYVQSVGRPLIFNHLSSPVRYTVH